MEFMVQRAPERDGLTPGVMYAGGDKLCLTMERPLSGEPADAQGVLHPRIVAGVFPFKLTYSPRAKDGTLWTPRADHRLPQVMDVPNRTGIRAHAANLVIQVIGCIAVGRTLSGPNLQESRVALIALIAKLDAAEQAGEPSTVEVVDA